MISSVNLINLFGRQFRCIWSFDLCAAPQIYARLHVARVISRVVSSGTTYELCPIMSSVKQQKGLTRLKPFCEIPSFLKSMHYHSPYTKRNKNLSLNTIST